MDVFYGILTKGWWWQSIWLEYKKLSLEQWRFCMMKQRHWLGVEFEWSQIFEIMVRLVTFTSLLFLHFVIIHSVSESIVLFLMFVGTYYVSGRQTNATVLNSVRCPKTEGGQIHLYFVTVSQSPLNSTDPKRGFVVANKFYREHALLLPTHSFEWWWSRSLDHNQMWCMN